MFYPTYVFQSLLAKIIQRFVHTFIYEYIPGNNYFLICSIK